MERVLVSYSIAAFTGRLVLHVYTILAGKLAMAEGCSTFNKVASELYKNLDSKEKDRLRNLCSEGEAEKTMTEKEIKKMGARIFKKIQSHVCGNILYKIVYL